MRPPNKPIPTESSRASKFPTSAAKVPVSVRALRLRLARALKRDGERLVVARGAKAIQDLGELCIIDISMNAVIARDVDLEAEARERGLLADWEALAAE